MAMELPSSDGYRISRIVCLNFSWKSLRISQFFLCQLEENHHLEVPQDLYKLLFERNLEIKCKVGCIFLMVTVSLLPRAVFGPTDHREDPPHFTRKPFSLKMILPPIKRTYCPLRSILAFVLVKTFPATEWSTISHQEIFIDSEKSYSIDESSADDDSPKNDESFSPTHRNHHSYSPKFT